MPRIRRVILVGVLGTFVCAQFSSVFVFHVAQDFESAALRSFLVAGPVIRIVLLRAGGTAVFSRPMTRDMTPFAVLGGAGLLFGVSLTALGPGPAPAVGAVLAGRVVSVAETAFGPMASAAYAALPIDSGPEAFNLRQVRWSFGEVLGALSGGALSVAPHSQGHGRLHRVVLDALTLTGRGPAPVPRAP
ncbi:hypothetical protein ACIA6T_29090 [Streptomyces sp. NPDC051740]|uniref:hypothetical protein n=1 Tax=Streptomyces sp. NPDC051740 TaxID=3365673 RepID=UPI00378CB68A